MLELELTMLELEGGGISGPLGVGELVSSEQDRKTVAIKAMLAKWNLNLIIKNSNRGCSKNYLSKKPPPCQT